MANKKDDERESILDEMERLWIMGVRKPYQLMKLLPISNWTTASQYLRVVERRVSRRGRKINKATYLQKQLVTYDQMITELWSCYRHAEKEKNVNGQVGALNSISKVLNGQAELLGLKEAEVHEPAPHTDDTLSPEQKELVGHALSLAFDRR